MERLFSVNQVLLFFFFIVCLSFIKMLLHLGRIDLYWACQMTLPSPGRGVPITTRLCLLRDLLVVSTGSNLQCGDDHVISAASNKSCCYGGLHFA